MIWQGPNLLGEWTALMAGPVFAIAVASYLLVRVDKTLGDVRDAMVKIQLTLNSMTQVLDRIEGERRRGYPGGPA